MIIRQIEKSDLESLAVLFVSVLNAEPWGLSRDHSWVELAWVAVAPAYRGRGIGKMVCGAVVTQLLTLGNSKIFGSTQDERLSAIKIYLDIGFHPFYRTLVGP
ncbi:MAG: GNAT superfamily N-acetyltransferase [Granulosicoccus sp.]|jgi:GNAT superfamily N-acetyltransferase